MSWVAEDDGKILSTFGVRKNGNFMYYTISIISSSSLYWRGMETKGESIIEVKSIKEEEKDDKAYLQLMRAKGYEIYNALPDSPEEDILKTLQHITDVLVGEEVLNLGIQVKVAFYNDASINAAVVKCNETYYIGLSIGVLHELAPFTENFIMKYLPYDFLEEKFGSVKLHFVKLYSFFEEGDIERPQLANHIANQILLLLLYHELGHIFSGHQELCNGASELYMEAVSSEKEDILSQAKEFMADFFSVANAILSCYNGNVSSIETVSYCQSLCLISLYSLYLYFEKNTAYGTYEELFHRSHPHPAVRLAYMQDFLDAEMVFQLGQVRKVHWFMQEQKKLGTEICTTALQALVGFTINMGDSQLIEESFEIRSIRLRCLIQNVANDLYEEVYRDMALVKFKEIGAMNYDYVKEMMEYEKFKSNEKG